MMERRWFQALKRECGLLAIALQDRAAELGIMFQALKREYGLLAFAGATHSPKRSRVSIPQAGMRPFSR